MVKVEQWHRLGGSHLNSVLIPASIWEKTRKLLSPGVGWQTLHLSNIMVWWRNEHGYLQSSDVVKCVCVCVCAYVRLGEREKERKGEREKERTCKCPAAAWPAWLKSSEKTMANREEASLCCELTQPNDLRTVNMACTRSAGNKRRQAVSWRGEAEEQREPWGDPWVFCCQHTAHLLPGCPSLFEEGTREGLARRRLAGSTASHRTHAVVPPGAHQGHIDPFNQSSQGGRGVPHRVSSPRLWSLTTAAEYKVEEEEEFVFPISLLVDDIYWKTHSDHFFKGHKWRKTQLQHYMITISPFFY